MEKTSFFHICADGADAKNFIVSEDDFKAAFNIIGVCAANCDVKVVAFSIEDTHPHFLLRGTRAACCKFRDMFEGAYKKYLVATRGSLDGVVLNCELIDIRSEKHLMNVGTYVVNQATKDQKHVMPFDYKWSSGPLYFRSEDVISIWEVKDGVRIAPIQVKSLSIRIQHSLFHSKRSVPGEWLVCDGLILPQNYVDVSGFEQIYKTHNCYRTFLSSGRAHDDPVVMAIAESRGVTMEDLEIRKPCRDMAYKLFGVRDVRALNVRQRLRLALELRRTFHLSRRQISTLVRLPFIEIEKYIK